MERPDVQDEIDDSMKLIDGGFPGTIDGVYMDATGRFSVSIEGMMTRDQLARIVKILDDARKRLAP